MNEYKDYAEIDYDSFLEEEPYQEENGQSGYADYSDPGPGDYGPLPH